MVFECRYGFTMNAKQHRAASEELLADAVMQRGEEDGMSDGRFRVLVVSLLQAQVHATLALAQSPGTPGKGRVIAMD